MMKRRVSAARLKLRAYILFSLCCLLDVICDP
jgi:hypothetical protein